MICYLYRPEGHRIWRGRYRLCKADRLHDVSLQTTDKQIADQRLREMVREAELEAAGNIPPKSVREAALKPVREHLDDFVGDLRRIGRADRHISNIIWRVGMLIKQCGWNTLANVTSESFQRWRRGQTLSPKTLNDYLSASSSLMHWLEKNELLARNPLKSIEKVQTEGHEGRHRRAFTDDELQKLLSNAGTRKVIYLLAIHTGLRRGELSKLRWGDIKLDSPVPFVEARASTTKNKKVARMRLHHEVLAALRELKPANASDASLVFPRFPRIERFRRDLKKAGVQYVDTQGRVADFHSLRYTFCTRLANSGVPSRVAMALMRHSDRRLTDKIYTDENLLGTWTAIEKLPSVGSQLGSQSPDAGRHAGSSTGTPSVGE